MACSGRIVAVKIHMHLLIIKLTPWIWPYWVAASFGYRWFYWNLLGNGFCRVLGKGEVIRPTGLRKGVIGTTVVIKRISPKSSIFIPCLQIIIIREDSDGRLKQVSTAVDSTIGHFVFLIELSRPQSGSGVYQISGSPKTITFE